MNQISSLPTYAELNAVVQNLIPDMSAAETHGLFCGHYCASIKGEKDWWADIFPGIDKDLTDFEFLQEIYTGVVNQLNAFALEFTLLLPDDEVDINLRAEALGLWCQGFLTGLKLGGVEIEQSEGDLKEALDDMIEISKISFGDITSQDEDESAYVELVEYIRLNTLMVFQELRKEIDNSKLH